MAEPEDSITHDVMISYDWEHQDSVLKIRNSLKEKGIKCWIDVENISGSTLEAMSAAVENSAIFLMCYSEKYYESENCQSEAEYARQLKKDIIPCKMERGYKAKGWLGFILGSKLFFEFSGKYPFEQKIEELVREIRAHLQEDKDAPETLATDVQKSLKIDNPPPKATNKGAGSSKVLYKISVSGTEGLRHIAFQPPENYWIGYENKVAFIDKSGNKLKEIQRYRFTFGAHSVTQDGVLVYLTGISVKKHISESKSENFITGTNVDGWKARSIYASHRNGDILIGLQNEEKGIGKISRYNKEGEYQSTIERDSSDSPLYTWPRFITENCNEDVVVSDWYGGVVATNKDGKHHFTYNISIPRAVVTDSKGRIYVCNNTPKIHVIDQNGKFQSYILTGLKDAFALYIHEDKELHVGFNAQKKITVYRITQ
ncbi:uncharacterized protein LOC133175816 [Saccostrea echinata]|uniref:uncharacterized protein LOC133175816 n=1 Tax=Saccostrea echinata TaxID=191078 RepID=UPI002A8334E6|nr:uncharacterized protein LOC133175816 [Saccostrea echinata]